MSNNSAPSSPFRPRRPHWARRPRSWLGALLLIYAITALWHLNKPLPEGLNARFASKPAEDVQLLVDATWITPDDDQVQRTEIFERMLELIAQAEQLIALEMFLINDFAGQAGSDHRPLSRLVIDAMIERKRQKPGLVAVLVTDPFNRLYGGVDSALFAEARAGGIEIIETELAALPDSNPLWSGFWRLCCRFLGNSPGGWLPNPVGGEDVSLRTYLHLLNFKANHRKALVVDRGDTWTGMVTTGNTHDASSRHSNLGLEFSGAAAIDLLRTIEATASFSGLDARWSVSLASEPAMDGSPARVSILTEEAIRDALLGIIDRSVAEDRLDIAVFYLSHRQVVNALARARERGVRLRVLLDPNEDAFGRKKDGVPNRQVALELDRAGVPIRWCNTRGEQCHYKHLLHIPAIGESSLLLGSANFTRRNLDGFNLETQALLVAPGDHPTIADAAAFFDQRWNNDEGDRHSLPYQDYSDPSTLRYWRYRLMEASGLSTF
jgi:phosphatidylserine/phosphatidylglycerophosphate/cardiolipin synthase-like enzyme